MLSNVFFLFFFLHFLLQVRLENLWVRTANQYPDLSIVVFLKQTNRFAKVCIMNRF